MIDMSDIHSEASEPLDWPTEPFIRITRGSDGIRGDLAGEYAVRDRDGDYCILGRGALVAGTSDRIYEWEEVTAVPTAALKHLQDMFRGVELSVNRLDALEKVLSYLPPDKPGAIDTAVKYAKRDDRGLGVDVDCYVARLLRSMPGDAKHPEYLDLLRIAKEAAQHLRWRGVPEPWDEITDEAKYLELPEARDGRFTLLVKQIGAFLVDRGQDTAASIGAVALSWAAEILQNGAGK